jgi:hypothetical protein
VRRIRVALGGIDEDAVLVSHADRLGLPPEQPSDDGAEAERIRRMGAREGESARFAALGERAVRRPPLQQGGSVPPLGKVWKRIYFSLNSCYFGRAAGR